MTIVKKLTGVCENHTNCSAVAIEPVDVVHFAHSARAKCLSITVKHDQSIRVAIPKGITQAAAEKFLRTKLPWVKKSLTKIQRLQKQRQKQPQYDIRNIDRGKAKAYLTVRINQLANKYGFIFNKIFIRNQKTRWGSCSSKDNISLNMKLFFLPVELQDYVILHELVHTREKNHNKKFWNELDKLVGDAKGLRKQMRQHRLK
jgi:predicted metal-dependent hydrolase